MNDLHISYKGIIPSYFEDDYDNAVSHLSSHMKNKHYYLHDRKIAYRNTTITEDYSTKNLNQAVFINCKFINSNLSCVSFVNSKFFNCEFCNCNLSSINFRNSIISNCIFNADNCFNNSKLGNCKLINCCFFSCELNSVSLDEATICSCKFEKNKWNAVTTDLCKFDGCFFDSVVFSNMNFEFSIFKDIHMNNMKLPFPTIPYIYGGLQYLISTNDNINITSQHNIKIGISKEEYLNELNNLEIFYSFSCNYFPLANIYFAQGKKPQGKAAIVYGINKAIENHDYRMIENYARLIKINSVFDMTERYNLYYNTISKISIQEAISYDDANRCLFNFRTFLFNSGNDSSFHLSIKTGIESETQLADLIFNIENVIRSAQVSSTYNIELRHNSPFELFINFFADYDSVCYLLGSLLLFLKGVDTVINKFFEYIKNVQEIQKQSRENKTLKQQIKLNELDIQLKKSEIEKIKQTEIGETTYSDTADINNHKVEINSVSYIILTNNKTQIIPSSNIFD